MSTPIVVRSSTAVRTSRPKEVKHHEWQPRALVRQSREHLPCQNHDDEKSQEPGSSKSAMASIWPCTRRMKSMVRRSTNFVLTMLAAIFIVKNIRMVDQSQYTISDTTLDLASMPMNSSSATPNSVASFTTSQAESTSASVSVFEEFLAHAQQEQQRQQQHQGVEDQDTSRSAPKVPTISEKMANNDGFVPPKSRSEYEEMVQKAIALPSQLDSQCTADPKTRSTLSTLIEPAMECLNKSSAKISHETMVYPIAGAHAHFNDIRRRLSQWAQHGAHEPHETSGYAGPWLENRFISHFESMYDKRIHEILLSSATSGAGESGLQPFCLSELFGPYIPIFLPWTDHSVLGKFGSPPKLSRTVLSLLRQDVPYIVLTQHDGGMLAHIRGLQQSQFPNMLVISAGGNGHVPIPLLKQSEDALLDAPLPGQGTVITTGELTDERRPLRKDPKDRQYVTSYVGSRISAPDDMREALVSRMEKLDPDPKARAVNNSTLQMFKYHYGPGWWHIMADSCFSFCPRGWGRTAYHVMETIQMGLIPIYVHMKIPWIPYIDLMQREEMVIVLRHDAVNKFMREELLPSLSLSSSRSTNWTFDKIRKTEERILSYRDSHFSFDGVLNQIEAFMLNPTQSDLRCQQLPDTARGP